MNKDINNWHKDFFNLLYWELFMKRSQEQISKEINIIEQLTKNHQINNILDVCCGVGDISYEIGKKKQIDAWGIEYSEDYVRNNYLKNIVQGDARIMQIDKRFSLVLNWFSSFSYFNKEDNCKILQNCFNYCDDVFVLETGNSLNVINKFVEKFVYNKTLNDKIYKIERVSNINIKDNTLEQQWIISHGENRKVHDTRTYMYFPNDIKEILLNIGFSKVELLGIDNQQIVELKFDTPRLLIKATK